MFRTGNPTWTVLGQILAGPSPPPLTKSPSIHPAFFFFLLACVAITSATILVTDKHGFHWLSNWWFFPRSGRCIKPRHLTDPSFLERNLWSFTTLSRWISYRELLSFRESGLNRIGSEAPEGIGIPRAIAVESGVLVARHLDGKWARRGSDAGCTADWKVC